MHAVETTTALTTMHKPNKERAEKARKLERKHRLVRGPQWENNEFLAQNIRERALHGIYDELDAGPRFFGSSRITRRPRATLVHSDNKATIEHTAGF